MTQGSRNKIHKDHDDLFGWKESVSKVQEMEKENEDCITNSRGIAYQLDLP